VLIVPVGAAVGCASTPALPGASASAQQGGKPRCHTAAADTAAAKAGGGGNRLLQVRTRQIYPVVLTCCLMSIAGAL
jgi:hypothetical protein